MTTKNKNSEGKTAEQKVRELIAACRAELQAIETDILGDYSHELEAGSVGWGHVTPLADLLRQLREAQGKEDGDA